MPGQYFELLHAAVLGDNRVEPNRARDAGLPGKRWIVRLHFVDQRSRGHRAALLDAGLVRPRRWRCSAHSTDDAADDAAHLAAGYAARSATSHARHAGIGLRVFLDDF